MGGGRRQAVQRAKQVLGQFVWKELDGGVAERTGQFLAYLHAKGQRVEYQDVVIAASAVTVGADHLVTENKEPFERLPAVRDIVTTTAEMRSIGSGSSPPAPTGAA